jgi:hypothetical protein
MGNSSPAQQTIPLKKHLTKNFDYKPAFILEIKIISRATNYSPYKIR